MGPRPFRHCLGPSQHIATISFYWGFSDQCARIGPAPGRIPTRPWSRIMEVDRPPWCSQPKSAWVYGNGETRWNWTPSKMKWMKCRPRPVLFWGGCWNDSCLMNMSRWVYNPTEGICENHWEIAWLVYQLLPHQAVIQESDLAPTDITFCKKQKRHPISLCSSNSWVVKVTYMSLRDCRGTTKRSSIPRPSKTCVALLFRSNETYPRLVQKGTVPSESTSQRSWFSSESIHAS